jgi:lipopolysaccharide/colanic/teichoic acid biosynthesis glycosyltransferase
VFAQFAHGCFDERVLTMESSISDNAELGLPTDIGLVRPAFWKSGQLICKRVLDLSVALGLIIFLFPVLLIAAVAVRLSSAGPVLFRQQRWGRGGSQFRCWKFRTMYINQDQFVDAAALNQMQAQGVLLKLKNDPRVTPIGAFLRKTSIDELPQLFNVLTGDMSLVGLCPLMQHMLAPFPELREARGRMQPGITGLWQISARENNETALQMAPYDLEYIREFNLWTDLKILARTPAAVLFGRGAH